MVAAHNPITPPPQITILLTFTSLVHYQLDAHANLQHNEPQGFG